LLEVRLPFTSSLRQRQQEQRQEPKQQESEQQLRQQEQGQQGFGQLFGRKRSKQEPAGRQQMQYVSFKFP
jgi:hypothetical protein